MESRKRGRCKGIPDEKVVAPNTGYNQFNPIKKSDPAKIPANHG